MNLKINETLYAVMILQPISTHSWCSSTRAAQIPYISSYSREKQKKEIKKNMQELAPVV